MVFRDCNSNIFNDFKRFFESKTWNCVLYGDFYGGKMCPSTQRNRESGPTVFQMIFLESSNSRKNCLSHFPRTLYICRNVGCLVQYILRTIWIMFFVDVKKSAILGDFVKCT